jgi:RNA polymerase sigma-70 factor (ECF subfamily)
MTAAEFEPVVVEHQQMVFRALTRLVGPGGPVEDLAQEVFLRLYRAIDQFRGEAQLTTYLYRILLNVAQDEWKRRRSRQSELSISDPDERWEDRLASPEPSAEERLGRSQLGAMLQVAMQQLSPAERSAIVLFHQEECTYEQIALALGLPIGTVRTHLHRGREKLKKLMQNRMELCTRTAKT